MALCTFDREAAFSTSPRWRICLSRSISGPRPGLCQGLPVRAQAVLPPRRGQRRPGGLCPGGGSAGGPGGGGLRLLVPPGRCAGGGEGYAFVNLKGALLHGSDPAPAPEATPGPLALPRVQPAAHPGLPRADFQRLRDEPHLRLDRGVRPAPGGGADPDRPLRGEMAAGEGQARARGVPGQGGQELGRGGRHQRPGRPEKTERSAAASSGAAQVLSRLGIRRLPTAELALYEKWTGQMGFAPDRVIAACADTARLRQPSFADLDRTLGRLAELELSTGSQIKTYLAEAQKLDAKCREMLRSWAGGRAAHPAQLQRYMHFTGAMGFSHKMVLQAARRAAQGQAGHPGGVAAQLERFDQLHLTTVSALQQYEKQLQHLDLTCRRCSPGRAARISHHRGGPGDLPALDRGLGHEL